MVGTHALVQERVEFKRLGFVVVDEQHRFGVAQRARLKAKGEHPDVLVMTATPIPRTLALTLYGDLDVSVLDELPPGRKPIVTVARTESRRPQIYDFLREQAAGGRQIYVVYPAHRGIRADRPQGRHRHGGAAAEARSFPIWWSACCTAGCRSTTRTRSCGGSRPARSTSSSPRPSSRSASTCPNASVMLIEHAERFGLSQLHQLRGRVGRGPWKSYCILLAAGRLGEDAERRVRAMVETNDGFRHRRGRPPAARPRRVLRHAPVGAAGVPRRRPAARCGDPRGGASRCPRDHRG